MSWLQYGILRMRLTGWVTDEDPAELAKMNKNEYPFQPPLDIVDGAVRVMDPRLMELIPENIGAKFEDPTDSAGKIHLSL
jgi:hypothetical protein